MGKTAPTEALEAKPKGAPKAKPGEAKCDKSQHKCTNNMDLECDADSDCGQVVAHAAAPAPAPHPSTHMRKGCDQKKQTCFGDDYQACKVDADCESYKCKKAPSQWIALVLAMSPFAPLGAAFAYISRWGLMALYLNATFLPCVLACILVCCFQPKLEDEAYRMPTAVWIMVFWGFCKPFSTSGLSGCLERMALMLEATLKAACCAIAGNGEPRLPDPSVQRPG